ncbi:MAG: hypothetical protein ACP5JJ_03015, partial [Anaerolineae bacterium]
MATNLEEVLAGIESDSQLGWRITHWRQLPTRAARHASFPAGIDPRLVDALRQRGIEQLYTHQAQAIAAVLRGDNVVV